MLKSTLDLFRITMIFSVIDSILVSEVLGCELWVVPWQSHDSPRLFPSLDLLLKPSFHSRLSGRNHFSLLVMDEIITSLEQPSNYSIVLFITYDLHMMLHLINS